MKRSAIFWVACGLTFLLQGTPVQAQVRTFKTETIGNIPYYQGLDVDEVRHRLDVYLPKGHKDYPVLFFVHGGAWIHGNKNHFGMYATLARVFTRQGIAVVCPNYRLSPKVQHPEHIRDVARAFAWTYRNIGTYGGNNREIFVSGHSAGGHLSALLATDETYLKENGLCLRDIRGAIPLSGLFIIPGDKVFDVAFGKDPALRRKASPIGHAGPGVPPFLVLLGENDLPSCDRPQAETFVKALRKNHVPAQLVEVPRRNHISILLNAVSDTDPVSRAMLTFMASQVTLSRLEQGAAQALDASAGFLIRYGISN